MEWEADTVNYHRKWGRLKIQPFAKGESTVWHKAGY